MNFPEETDLKFSQKKTAEEFPETADIETSSDDYARRFSGKVGEYFLNVQARITLDLLKPWPGASVLDVGGGHAQLAVPLVENGFKVTVLGSDLSCRQRLDRFLPQNSFRFQTGNIIQMPFADNSFDVVLAFRLLPHVDRWQQLAAELSRVAKKAVIIDYPDIRSFNSLYQILFNIKKAYEGNTRPFQCFSRKEILREFKKHGLKNPVFRPEYFIPMVIHRSLKIVPVLKFFEILAKITGLTLLLGSPIILKMEKIEDKDYHSL